MFSLAGIPPFLGFWAKLAVLRAAIEGGMLWLAIVGIVFAVVGAFYYLRVVKVMYFDEPVGDSPPRNDRPLRVAFGVNALALLVLGIFWNPLMAWCQQAFAGLSSTDRDISDATELRSAMARCVRLLNRRSAPAAGWSSLAARRAHNPKVAGSNPAPATSSRWRKRLLGAFFVSGDRAGRTAAESAFAVHFDAPHRIQRIITDKGPTGPLLFPDCRCSPKHAAFRKLMTDKANEIARCSHPPCSRSV